MEGQLPDNNDNTPFSIANMMEISYRSKIFMHKQRRRPTYATKYKVGWLTVQEAREIVLLHILPKMKHPPGLAEKIATWDESVLPWHCFFIEKEQKDGHVQIIHEREHLWIHILLVRAFGRWLPKYVISFWIIFKKGSQPFTKNL